MTVVSCGRRSSIVVGSLHPSSVVVIGVRPSSRQSSVVVVRHRVGHHSSSVASRGWSPHRRHRHCQQSWSSVVVIIVVAVMVGHPLWLFVVGCQSSLSTNHRPSSLSPVVVVVVV